MEELKYRRLIGDENGHLPAVELQELGPLVIEASGLHLNRSGGLTATFHFKADGQVVETLTIAPSDPTSRERSARILKDCLPRVDDWPGVLSRFPSMFESFMSGAGGVIEPYTAMSAASFAGQGDVDIKYVVDPFVPEESTAMIVGREGRTKTWQLLDLANAAATGSRWLGRFPCRKSKVLYIDRESAEQLLRARLRWLARGRGMETPPEGITLLMDPSLSLANPTDVARLRATIESDGPFDLMMIDSLVRVIGGADENSASEMAAVFEQVKMINRDYHLATVFADHQRKPAGFQRNDDVAALTRGSGEKLAFVDTQLSLGAVPNKEKNWSLVEHTKSRWASPVPRYLVAVEDIGDDPRTKGVIVTYKGEADEVLEEARLGDAKEALLLAISDGGSSQTDVLSALKEQGFGKTIASDAIQALDGDGLTRTRQKSKPGQPYILHRDNDETPATTEEML